jgi:hypothetical protein
MHEESDLQEEVLLQPVEITVTSSPKAQPADIEIPPGHVLIIALHPDGTEIAGSEFFYPEKTYRRYYGDEAKFLVKKNFNHL